MAPPPSSQSSNSNVSRPAALHRPKAPNAVLAEAELQWIYTEEELLHTPSIVDGMSAEQEREMRSKGINFIGQVGVMLKLSQMTLTTAAVYFNRFLMRRSLVNKKEGAKALHHYQIAAVCIFLATKVEETCRKMKEIVVVICRVAQKNPNLIVDEQTKDYWRWRDTILMNEDHLLEAIAFDLTIDKPHKLMFDMLQYYRESHNKELRNSAWTFINDSAHTQLCILFPARTIAAAAVYCGAKYCRVDLPDEGGKPWWEVQHVSLREIRRACNYMAGIYEKTPVKEGVENIYTPESVDMEREGSSQSVKRAREDDEVQNGDAEHSKPGDKEAANGKEEAGHQSKKVKTGTNGVGSGASATKEDEEVASEEGEVEE
ncbi:cyclin-like protein [Pseudovirgaria hyperparasitica]|uniref:RNA polymerase II holoenzyme cyclin-like subunit n=1 Tax=Pseudovirgaria hyperparasitica TaxID=470096 RepID=A0A6A6WHF8_9PEZI|nr:cyclin-like protein [Pseudovirgaria hyperparasitica]KAF2761426.1 cyclin-like protein [Pseudovirgaria hyperparasitica]